MKPRPRFLALMAPMFGFPHLPASGDNADAHAGDRPNLLLITIDDLNDWVGCLDGQITRRRVGLRESGVTD